MYRINYSISLPSINIDNSTKHRVRYIDLNLPKTAHCDVLYKKKYRINFLCQQLSITKFKKGTNLKKEQKLGIKRLSSPATDHFFGVIAPNRKLASRVAARVALTKNNTLLGITHSQ